MTHFSQSTQKYTNAKPQTTDQTELLSEHDPIVENSAFWEFVDQNQIARQLDMHKNVDNPSFPMLAPAEDEFAALLADSNVDVPNLSAIISAPDVPSLTQGTSGFEVEKNSTPLYAEFSDPQYQNAILSGYTLPSIHEVSNLSLGFPPPALEHELSGLSGLPASIGLSEVIEQPSLNINGATGDGQIESQCSSLTDGTEVISGLNPGHEPLETHVSVIQPATVLETPPVQHQEQNQYIQTSDTYSLLAINTYKGKSRKRKQRTEDDNEQDERSASSSKRAKVTRVPRAPYSVEEREWLMSAWSSNRGERRYKDWNQVAEAFNIRFPPKDPGAVRTAAGLSSVWRRANQSTDP